MIKAIKKWYLMKFPKYRRLEMKSFTYSDADKLLKENQTKTESQQWHLAKEEDNNQMFGIVYLERRERITE